MRYVAAGRSATGTPLPVDDPLAPRIAAITAGADSAAADRLARDGVVPTACGVLAGQS